MTNRMSFAVFAAALGTVLAVNGCGKKEAAPAVATPESAPAAAPAAVEAPAAPASAPAASAEAPAAVPRPAQTVLASQEYSQDPDLRCDVLEAKRVAGGALLIKWRLSKAPAPAAAGGLAAVEEGKKTYHTWSWNGVYYTDPAENKKYSGLKDSAGEWIAQGDSKNYEPGQQQVIWMKFPAPPPASTKITFVFPGFPPFEDLPVS